MKSMKNYVACIGLATQLFLTNCFMDVDERPSFFNSKQSITSEESTQAGENSETKGKAIEEKINGNFIDGNIEYTINGSKSGMPVEKNEIHENKGEKCNNLDNYNLENIVDVELKKPAVDNTNSYRDVSENLVIEPSQFYNERMDIKKIPVLMYHEVGNHHESPYSSRYVISPDNFRKQLNFLYEKGFVPVSIDEYLNDDFSEVPLGKRPVILTFDDATIGQFRFIEGTTIDPESAVGILDDFSQKHDDWRKRAAFFIDFVDNEGYFQVPFEQRGKEREKISYLLKKGYEVYCHTFFHPSLDSASYKSIVNDIKTFNYVMQDFDIQNSSVIAMPYGAYPSADITWEFLDRKFDFYFAAFAKTRDKRAERVDSTNFNPRYIPRIEAPSNSIPTLKRYLKGF